MRILAILFIGIGLGMTIIGSTLFLIPLGIGAFFLAISEYMEIRRIKMLQEELEDA